MKNNKKIMLLAGDGVGPEVVNETTRIIKWFEDNLNLSFDLDEGLVGGASYDKFGVPLTDETLADAMSADAILFGSVGGPQYDKVSFDNAKVPVYSNVNATPSQSADELKNNVLQQLLKPVLWTQTIEQMVSDGVKEVIELGPGKVLQGLVKRIDRTLQFSGIQ